MSDIFCLLIGWWDIILQIGVQEVSIDKYWDIFKFFFANKYCGDSQMPQILLITQQNSKYALYGDRNETINHIISKCCKLAQKEYKTRHDWVGKEIHWESCKKFKFDNTNKWYMHNPASILENDTHKLLWDFNIQMDHLISARKPDLIIIKKKKRTCKIVDFAVPADHRIKLQESEKKILLGNWKNYKTWKWQLYQFWLVLLVHSPKDY